ncbi:hypothetical protein [Gilvimarinus sp. DA14]|uniref:hypothetical protein n=1 Tax=Gilvimarinus sp. DA14 TaxID=2956798 RepID=UPI0020B79970|nr:hypothetical protein [Gilvimarinus sp. DA14]UTF59551.1 hypothetical protein NHM04_13870 [Gilvimarinus sp. DA14]
MLLAFLLPLKVLILIGSEGLPHYLPKNLIPLERDTLILCLSIATPGFFVLHLIAERLLRLISDSGAKRLLTQSRKVVLFENQDDIAASSYRRYAEALSNAVFIACVWLAVAVFFPPLCLFLIGYTAICTMSIALVHKCSKPLRERIDENLVPLTQVLTAIGFLLAFLLLVVQFLSGAAQGFLFAIISLLLTRQAFTRTNQLVSAIVNLHNNRRKLNALFFAHHTLSQKDEKQFQFWSLFVLESREHWLRSFLLEHLAINPQRLSIYWHQTGVNEVVALEVDALDDKEERIGRYLLRLYGRTPSLLASHEATLLFEESSKDLPALPLLAAGPVEKWHCHLFALPDNCTPVAPGKHSEAYLAALWSFDPPEDLTDRYARSHPILWQRLDADVFERLYMAASDQQRPLVHQLEELLPDMLARLRNLPLAMVNPEVNANTLLQDGEGKLWISAWGRWALEPLGSSWPIAPKSLQNISHALQQASKQRPALKSVDVQAVILAALLFQFDRLCTRQLYLDALALIPRLLKAQANNEY